MKSSVSSIRSHSFPGRGMDGERVCGGRVDGGCLVMVNGGMIEKIDGDCK